MLVKIVLLYHCEPSSLSPPAALPSARAQAASPSGVREGAPIAKACLSSPDDASTSAADAPPATSPPFTFALPTVGPAASPAPLPAPSPNPLLESLKKMQEAPAPSSGKQRHGPWTDRLLSCRECEPVSSGLQHALLWAAQGGGLRCSVQLAQSVMGKLRRSSSQGGVSNRMEICPVRCP